MDFMVRLQKVMQMLHNISRAPTISLVDCEFFAFTKSKDMEVIDLVLIEKIIDV